MNELIKIENKEFNNKTIQTVCARDVYAFLQIQRDFSNWIKDQINRATLVEGTDFLFFAQKGENSGRGRSLKEYYLTIDSAKHICMLSANEKGKQLRQYFIDCESKFHNLTQISQIDLYNPRTLQQILISYTDKVIKLESQLEGNQSKVIFYDKFSNAEGLYNLQNAARALNQRPNLFIRSLKDEYLFYQGLALVPYHKYRELGLFEVKSTILEEKARYQTYITPKGLQYFAEKLAKKTLEPEQIPVSKEYQCEIEQELM